MRDIESEGKRDQSEKWHVKPGSVISSYYKFHTTNVRTNEQNSGVHSLSEERRVFLTLNSANECVCVS